MPNVEMDQQVPALGKNIYALLNSGATVQGAFSDLGNQTSDREYILIGEWKVREADISAWKFTA